MTGRRRASLVVPLMLMTLTLPGAPVATAAPPGFITRSGTQLQLNGQPFRFAGLNIYNANSDGWCWDAMRSGPALDQALTAIGPGKSVMRAWFFQPLAIDKGTGLRDWSGFDHTLQVAAAHGMKVIVTLTDQWGECGTNVPGNDFKSDQWYIDGYTQIQPGMLVSYRDGVAEVVARYEDDPTVAFWQLINEAEVTDSTHTCQPGDGPADILRSWAQDVGGLVKSIDPNHLVSLGTIGSGQCGAQGDQYRNVHNIPQIDLCEFHDYGAPLVGIPGDQWNGLQVRLNQCAALNKPLFVGEAGIIPSDVGGTLQGRADAFRAKIAAQCAAGVQGFLAWAWHDPSTLNNYDIGPGDPSLAALTPCVRSDGFFAPVDNDLLNVGKAGQTIPLKFRLTDGNGTPVTNLATVTLKASSLSCSLGTTPDLVEEYATGASGLQNLGNGYYQYNWKTPKTYAASCKIVSLNVGNGIMLQAQFRFTK